MHTQILLLIGVAGLMFLIIGGLAFISHYYTLNGIKSKTVGDGQHGTARWATKQEIRQTYAHIPFEPELWRQGKNLPDQQGLILGCEGPKGHVTAVVDTDDIHALVTAASGAGKTAFFLYPNIEYALATGMSFLCTDTKGDLFRNYAGIARECYGYQTAILDLRNPTRSDGNNLLHLINKYMDIYKAEPDIVLLETMKSADREHRVFKLQFAVGEFDMVIYDEKENCCEIFEIKHSDKQVPAQYRHLADQEKCDKTERRFGPIRGRYVLYRGEDAALENGVQYRNVERYLNDLPEMDITPVQEAGIEQTGPVL